MGLTLAGSKRRKGDELPRNEPRSVRNLLLLLLLLLQGSAMVCVWDGNRRFGVTPAVRYRRSGLSTYRLSGLDSEISIAPTLRKGMAPFTCAQVP